MAEKWLIRGREDVEAMHTVLARQLSLTATERESFAAYAATATDSASTGENSRILTTAGSTAEIRIDGPMMPTASRFARFFGIANTGYDEIQEAIALAESDPAVKDVVFALKTPGGTVAGLFDTLAAVQGMDKPKRVIADCACSAGYAIAALAGKIEAVNAASEFGSIGVAIDYVAFADEKTISITSTNAPKKRPDVETEEGRAVVREVLDEIHDLFVGEIATGRSLATGKTFTADDINADFGQGATRLAASAKAAGMIDRIAKPAARKMTTATAAAIETTEKEAKGPKVMDLVTLEKEHPEVFAAAKAAGVADERSRVKAHLTLAEKMGANEIAFKAIREGKLVTDQECHSDYLVAAMNRSESNAIQAETEEAASAVDPNAEASAELDDEDKLALAMDRILGEVA